eukprot:GHVP01026181.1.p1 GENE.GHVP01026181.1~~GHVP01026181.1.p1  ORF type:complete len:768 (+),score=119.98 GHVP01026181.1:247-2304(+)
MSERSGLVTIQDLVGDETTHSDSSTTAEGSFTNHAMSGIYSKSELPALSFCKSMKEPFDEASTTPERSKRSTNDTDNSSDFTDQFTSAAFTQVSPNGLSPDHRHSFDLLTEPLGEKNSDNVTDLESTLPSLDKIDLNDDRSDVSKVLSPAPLFVANILANKVSLNKSRDKVMEHWEEILHLTKLEYLMEAHRLLPSLIHELDHILKTIEFSAHCLVFPHGFDLKDLDAFDSFMSSDHEDHESHGEVKKRASKKWTERGKRVAGLIRHKFKFRGQKGSQAHKKFESQGIYAEKFELLPRDIKEKKNIQKDNKTRFILDKHVWHLWNVPAFAYTSKSLEPTKPTKDKDKEKGKKQGKQGKQELPVSGSLSNLPSPKEEELKVPLSNISLPVKIEVRFHPMMENDKSTRKKNVHIERTMEEEDEASEFLLWVHSTIEVLLNSCDLHRLRCFFESAQDALTVLNSPGAGWSNITNKQYTMKYKMWEDGSAVCLMDGVLDAKTFDVLVCVNEIHSHKNWVPMVNESVEIHAMTLFSRIISHKASLPWPLQPRDTVLYGFALDLLEDKDHEGFIMCGCSVPDDACSMWNLPVSPTTAKTTRMDIKFFTFALYPQKDDPEKTGCKFLVSFNPRVNFIPDSLASFAARQSATTLWGNLQKLCSKKDKPLQIYANPIIYGAIKQKLEKFYGHPI